MVCALARILAVLQDAFGLVLLGRGQRVQRGVGQLAGAAVAVLGILGHALGDHLIQGRRNLPGPQLAGPRGWLHQMRGDQPFDAVGHGTAVPR